ncbi:MAG: enoyl-CoA hydratase [Gammaproteobacteria bacterium]|nr:enoyl-CoA hydratase [Gammaproteobacteria bacterium]MBT4493141.1 enoyl-CoA hydratase [Gammaproteobacteria bacterium]MBT7371785.1 enoyl-CoA hydratase [Gammaproteobacteria bacterium]
MNYKYLNVSSTDRVTTIELNRPEVMNAINPEMHEELQLAFDGFAADDEQFLCLVRGAGDRAFCAGSDLKAIAEADERQPYPENGYAGLIERYHLNKPVIAAVDGFALGGGFEIALACDIIIATTRSSFGLPEPLVGAVALGGGVHRLSRQIGLKQAMGMVLTADRVSATRGMQLGFVNEVVEVEEFDNCIDQWVESILRCAPLSLAASKEAILRGLDEPSLADAITNQETYPAFYRWKRSEDATEGPKAFAEKRTPNWQGK